MSDRQDGDKQILARIDGALKKYDTPGLPVLNPKLDVWECNGMVCYDGQCFPVTLGDTKIGLKCMSEACGSISKGELEIIVLVMSKFILRLPSRVWEHGAHRNGENARCGLRHCLWNLRNHPF